MSVANAAIFGGGSIAPPANACAINFRCPEICPGGIIGQVNRVTCEIENATAQGNCEAGKPFARGFDCDAQLPRFGILFPGLDPGFSIFTPWGSIDAVVQGDGRVDIRVNVTAASAGPVDVFVETTGSYQPSTGEMRWDVGGGLQYGIASEDAVLNVAGEYDIGPSGVVRYSTEQPQVKLELDGGMGIFITN